MWTMDKARTGAAPARRNVAINMRAIRRSQKVSLRALSARMKALGRGLSPDALSKIETGGLGGPKQLRRVDVDDLVTIALALGVTPNRLMMPGPSTLDDPAQLPLTTVVKAGPRSIWRWANGEAPLPASTFTDAPTEDHLLGDCIAAAEWQQRNNPHSPPPALTIDELAAMRKALEPVLDAARRVAHKKSIPIARTAEFLRRYSQLIES